jgi:hypothetical protein
LFRVVHEAHGGARATGAAGAADTVHVVFRELRQVVVEHVRDAGDVDAAGRDVGRDQHAHATLAQRTDRAVARALRQVAVQRGRFEAGASARRPASWSASILVAVKMIAWSSASSRSR